MTALSPERRFVNQPPPLVGFNALVRRSDNFRRQSHGRRRWIAPRAGTWEHWWAANACRCLAAQANRFAPELRRTTASAIVLMLSNTIRLPRLMALAFGAGLHSRRGRKQAGSVGRACALNYLWNQGENGVTCPVTMTFASVRVLRNERDLAVQWNPSSRMRV